MIENGQQGGGYVLKYGGYAIPFQVEPSRRSALTIHVHPDLRLEVLAPVDKDRPLILERVDRRANWIVKQWRYFEQFRPPQPSRRFVGGETHLYLGRQYRLKISRDTNSEVKLIGKYFRVQLSDPSDAAQISQLLHNWYLEHAQALFANRMRFWMSECRALALPTLPKLLVRPMTRRWGSCSKKGTITLNVDLVKVPMSYIDYVIVHELCHQKIHDHSSAFYRLLSRCMPDWEQRKRRLDLFHAT